MKQALFLYFNLILLLILFNQSVIEYHVVGQEFEVVLVVNLIFVVYCAYLFIKEITTIKVDKNGRIDRKD